MGAKHLLCKENRPLSVKINVYSMFSRYNAEIKQQKCVLYKQSIMWPTWKHGCFIFYLLSHRSGDITHDFAFKRNKKKKKVGGRWWRMDKLNPVISVSSSTSFCLPFQKFIINCVSKSGFKPPLLPALWMAWRTTVYNRGGHNHGDTVLGLCCSCSLSRDRR